jgi:hypothetical protein
VSPGGVPVSQLDVGVGAYFPRVFVYHAFEPELREKYNVKRGGYVMGTFSVDFLSDVGESSLHPKPGLARPEAYLVTGCIHKYVTTSVVSNVK